MEIELLKRHWDALGRDDPLWAVLTEPDAKGGRWKLDEFLARGEHDVATFLSSSTSWGSATSAAGRSTSAAASVA